MPLKCIIRDYKNTFLKALKIIELVSPFMREHLKRQFRYLFNELF